MIDVFDGFVGNRPRFFNAPLACVHAPRTEIPLVPTDASYAPSPPSLARCANHLAVSTYLPEHRAAFASGSNSIAVTYPSPSNQWAYLFAPRRIRPGPARYTVPASSAGTRPETTRASVHGTFDAGSSPPRQGARAIASSMSLGRDARGASTTRRFARARRRRGNDRPERLVVGRGVDRGAMRGDEVNGSTRVIVVSVVAPRRVASRELELDRRAEM